MIFLIKSQPCTVLRGLGRGRDLRRYLKIWRGNAAGNLPIGLNHKYPSLVLAKPGCKQNPAG
jgi:hypothetical protein